MNDPEYRKGFDEGFDRGFDAAITQLLYFIERYDDNDIEFKIATTTIYNDIRKYFQGVDGRYVLKEAEEKPSEKDKDLEDYTRIAIQEKIMENIKDQENIMENLSKDHVEEDKNGDIN